MSSNPVAGLTLSSFRFEVQLVHITSEKGFFCVMKVFKTLEKLTCFGCSKSHRIPFSIICHQLSEFLNLQFCHKGWSLQRGLISTPDHLYLTYKAGVISQRSYSIEGLSSKGNQTWV